MAVEKVAGAGVKKGSALEKVIEIVNDLAAGMNTLTAQLDSDGGVTDTDYADNVGTINTIQIKDTGVSP